MKVLYPITLDVKKTNIQKHIKAFTSEGGTRELIITLVSGNDTIELTNEYVVSVVGVKPDGTEFANTATVSDGKIHYTLTTQNVAVEGEVDCHIRVVKTNELLYTSKFAIDVEKNLSDEETETSSNEWTELINALNRVNNMSIVWSGEGAPSTDPEEYPDIEESNFYYDETNNVYYYATNVSTTVTWKRIYNKDEVDAALDLKADKSTTYTKTEVDTALLTKADKSTTYTKTEVDAALSSKQNTLSEGNGIAIENDEVAVALESGASGNILGFNNEYLSLHGDTVAKDANFKTELAKYVYTETEVDNLLAAKQALLTAGNGIYINNDEISIGISSSSSNILGFASGKLWLNTNALPSDTGFQASMPYDTTIRQRLADTSVQNALQPKLTAGTNITIDSNNVISASGGGNPITDTAKGSTISLTDSADSPLDAISIMGKSTQNGTPTIDTPIPIVDITSEEVEITNGTDTQQAELTKTLRGIPVASGGNYTDNNNQQWLCDTIERYKDGSGKYIQRVGQIVLDGSKNWRDDNTRVYIRIAMPNSNSNTPTTLFSHASLGANATQVINVDNKYVIVGGSLYISPTQNGTRLNAEQFKTYLASNNATLEYVLDTPIETPLTSEELAELELSTYYPTTNISSNTDVVVEYVVDIETALSTKQDKLTAGTNITIDSNNVISASGELSIDYNEATNKPQINSTTLSGDKTSSDLGLQDKLTAGTNITIDSNNVISASGGGSYTFTDGLVESSGTVGIDLASGSKLLIDANDKLDVDLSSKQDTIDSTHKLSADNVDDTNTTNKFVSANEKQTWNNKADNTTITTDTTSTTVSLTLADNHEYRYTQELTSLTLTMPSGNFISSIVFASGSTPTSMTYDSSIKWSGDDVTNGQFVPSADKDYDICLYYNGLNVNGIVRGV